MELIQAFVNNGVKVTVSVLMVLLFGIIALTRMPIQLTPEVQIPTITVETRWPGASPPEVEREIILEQEEQLKSVEGMTKMTSEAMDSMGRITMEFAVGTDLSESQIDVLTRLAQVPEYPEDADEPVISTANLSDRPIAWFVLTQRTVTDAAIRAFQEANPALREVVDRALSTQNPSLRNRRLQDAAQTNPAVKALLPEPIEVPRYLKFAEDFIESRFERVPGVANANVLGGEEEEMRVMVDPQRLAARQLTIGDVRSALRAQNQDISGGDFWEGKRRYVVRTMGQYRSPQEVADTIIATRDASPVYVRDVAQVGLGYKKPVGTVRRYGSACLAINALRETNANVLNVMEGLQEAATELNEGVLKTRGLQLTQVYDETDYIYSAIGLVQSNIFVGGALTFIVLLLFLRSGWSTVIIASAIPTSIIGTFLILNILGRSLNVISLAGLAFAVGMLVDNAVVVLENIYRHYQSGEKALTAAVRGATEVWGAIVSSTLTTLAVFLPVMFVEEEAGQLFRDIALAISAAVGLSLIVSIIVIPTAAAYILKDRGGPRRHGPLWRLLAGPRWLWTHVILPPLRLILLHPLDVFGKWFADTVVGLNTRLQRSWWARLATVAAFMVVSIGLSYLLMPQAEYLPAGNRNLVFGILLPPPGYNLNQLRAIGDQVEEDLRPYWDVDPGSPEAKQLDYPPIADMFFVAFGRQLFMGIRSADPLRAGELVGLIQQVTSQIPGMIGVAKQSSLFESGLTAGRTIDVELVGPELEHLVGLGRGGPIMVDGKPVMWPGVLPMIVAGNPATGQGPLIPNAQARPVPSLDLSSPELQVTLRPEQARDLGVTATELGYVVDALVDGAYAGDYYLGGTKIDLAIVGVEQYASRTQDLAALAMAAPTGDLVPLAAVAKVELKSGPEQINHRERQRAITIEVSPPPEVPLERAMDLITSQVVEPMRSAGLLGTSYQVNLAGTADKLRATWIALRFNIGLALLITYLLMAALFESWLYPFVIILTVPLGAVGGLAALWLLNLFVLQQLDVLTMLGFVILIGTVVNNPILIVHQSLIHMREDGMGYVQAINEAVRTRIRPIFMTTLTTVLGLLPLVLFPGAGSELYRGLGSVVLGGLLVSTIFTLILVPSLFSLTLQARDAVMRWLGSDAPGDDRVHAADQTATEEIQAPANVT